MVTCLSENFYESLEHKPLIRDLQDFQLNDYDAGGNVLPFLGYIEAVVRIPCLTENPFFVPLLVRKLFNSDSDSDENQNEFFFKDMVKLIAVGYCTLKNIQSDPLLPVT